ncbi:hypothetical protein [Magnetospirillum moscoviense]|uniref:hypothetical protein n=1 Tax=Magnetospirillum moscoviense TaxID=1437059 RepID=UPI0012E796C3|nr:hypothetical protein [Magnetospirillum moscoviense]
MLTSAHRFIDLITALHGLQVLTPAQCADLSAFLRAGFPANRPEAYKALRDVLHLRQIPPEDFAEQCNAVMRAYKNPPGALPGHPDTPERAITIRTKDKRKREGALQGKSVIFPRGDER